MRVFRRGAPPDPLLGSLEADRGQFQKGRAKTGGRRRGTPNRATRAVKEFLSEMLDRTDVQAAIRRRILDGDTAAFFKAVEIVHGKPRQAVEGNQASKVVYCWAGELEDRLEEDRRVSRRRTQGTESTPRRAARKLPRAVIQIQVARELVTASEAGDLSSAAQREEFIERDPVAAVLTGLGHGRLRGSAP